MDIGTTIKKLRIDKGITQETFANVLDISVQTVSRWENNVNYPDLSMLPLIATFFHVSTDFLLGMKGENNMAKLLKTVETFELVSKSEAEELVLKFKGEKFPILKEHKITKADGKIILEATKEFNADMDNMKF
ncbi:helix-turn-helix domain-containing protein [Parablautia muri]|uniref:XRE family transcriptional regulator n=1 Tax=Parablautia muri TaxID=2320879 RepID=A0A9X5GUE7_9FIRM|nr:helix-turn-helix transcriptional regulator [Parablautia muri]NBJ95094.1 XRE family transcriptional regulator [Parablautia muri]